MAESAIAQSSSFLKPQAQLQGSSSLLLQQSLQQHQLPSAYGTDRSQQRTTLETLLPSQSKYQANSYLGLGLLPFSTPPSIKDLDALQSTLNSYKTQLIALQNSKPLDPANQEEYNKAVIKLQTKIDLLSSKVSLLQDILTKYQKAKAALDASTYNQLRLQQDVAVKTQALATAQADEDSSSKLLTEAQQNYNAAQDKLALATSNKEDAQQKADAAYAALQNQIATTNEAARKVQTLKDAASDAASFAASAKQNLSTQQQDTQDKKAIYLSTTSNEVATKKDLAAATVQLQTKQDAYDAAQAKYSQTTSTYNNLINTYNEVYAKYQAAQQAQQQAQSNVDQAQQALTQAQQNYDNNLIPDPTYVPPTIQVPHTRLVTTTSTQLTGGLTADSFNRQNYGSRPPLPQPNEIPIATQTVPNINYNWGSGQVLNSGKQDRVLVRFTGNISFPTTQDVQFYAPGDDGVQLYIDGNLVINDWYDKGGGGSQSSYLHFEAGSTHTITLYFYENGGGANVWLYYATPYTGYQIVPAAYLGTQITTKTTTTEETYYTTEVDSNAQAPLIHDPSLLPGLQQAQDAYDQALQEKQQADVNFQQAQQDQQQAAQDTTTGYNQVIADAQVVNQAYADLQAAQQTSNEAQQKLDLAHQLTIQTQQTLDQASAQLEEVQRTSNEARQNLLTANSQLSQAQDELAVAQQKQQDIQTSNEAALKTSNEAIRSFNSSQQIYQQTKDQLSSATSNEASSSAQLITAQQDLETSNKAASDAASVVASDQTATDSSATSYQSALDSATSLTPEIDAAIAEAKRIASLPLPPTPTPTPDNGDPNIPVVITDLTKLDIAKVDPTQISDAQVVQLQTAANQVLDAAPENSPEYQHALDVLYLAAQADDIQVDPQIAAIPGIGAAVQGLTNVVNLVGNIGSDIAPKVRKKAQKVVVTTVVVGQIAQAAAAATAAGGGSSTRTRIRRK